MNDSQVLICYDADGNVLRVWTDHKVRSDAGDMEAADPPTQPDEAGRATFERSDLPTLDPASIRVDSVDDPQAVTLK